MNNQTHHDAASDCDAIIELVADYAFGLTSADESRLVESRLSGCPEAAEQLEVYRRIQDELRVEVPQIDPPRALGERIMAAAVAPAVKPRPKIMSLSPAWLAAAAAVVLLVLTNVYWLSRVDAPQPDSFGTLTINAEDIRWAKLAPEDAASDAATFIMWNAGGDTGMMYAEHFPALESNQIYQLWLTRDGVRTKAGTFRVNEEGEGTLLFRAEAPVGNFDWAWVTIEPEGGSEQPSDDIVTGGEL